MAEWFMEGVTGCFVNSDILSSLLKDIWEDGISVTDYSDLYMGWVRSRSSSPIDWPQRERVINGMTPPELHDRCVCGVSAGEVHRPRCPIWMGHDSGYSLKKERCEHCDGYFVALRNNLCWVCQYHVDVMVKRLSD